MFGLYNQRRLIPKMAIIQNAHKLLLNMADL